MLTSCFPSIVNLTVKVKRKREKEEEKKTKSKKVTEVKCRFLL